MSKILITGASGFTGRYLSSALVNDGHEVIGITHGKSEKDVSSNFESHVCNLTDLDTVHRLFSDIKPDKVIHLAAIAFVGHGLADDIYKTNVIGSRNLLEAASSVGEIDAVLLASSANIYGNRTSGPISENAEPNPANDYAVSKISMEYVAQLYIEKLPIIIARPFNYTGVGQSVNFIIPKIIDHIKRREPIIELGNLNVSRDFSDVRDVVQSYTALLNSSDAVGQVFNICSGKSHSLDDVISMIRGLSDHEFSIRVNPSFVRKNEVETLWGDRSRLEAMTGQQPSYELHDTLAWMLGSSN